MMTDSRWVWLVVAMANLLIAVCLRGVPGMARLACLLTALGALLLFGLAHCRAGLP